MPKAKSAKAKRSRRPSVKDWARIRLFAMDVDGVLTDGTVFILSEGGEAKRFSILDGLGMVKLGRQGVAVAWISGRPSKATSSRANELKIPHLIQGRTDKRQALEELALSLGLKSEDCAYMGDDEIDTEAIAWAGIGIAPDKAMPCALKAARYIPKRPAGQGAVREICELILEARGPQVKTGK